MDLWKNKDAKALSALVEFVNLNSNLKNVCLTSNSLSTQTFSKNARSWINSTVRPIMKCMHFHFQDNMEDFMKTFPNAVASQFKKHCDGSIPVTHKIIKA